MRNSQSFSVAVTGVTVTTTISTSATGVLPVTQAGTKPRFVRIVSLAAIYVRLTVGAGTAVNTDMLVLPGAPVILEVGGMTNYNVIDDGTSTKVNITPLEDS